MKKRSIKEKRRRQSEWAKKAWRDTTHFLPPAVKPTVVAADEIRRLEYFDALNEVSGSTEGAELESLSVMTSQHLKNFAFEVEEQGDFDDLYESIMTNFK